jgi:hypothetical protein
MRLNEIKPMLDMSIYYFTLHSSLALSTFTQHKRARIHIILIPYYTMQRL